MELIAGGRFATNVNPPARLPLVEPTMTTTSADAAACCGVTAVMVVALTTATLAAGVPPIVTVAAAEKLAPEMVIDVPPVVAPAFGATEVTRGELGEGRRSDSSPPHETDRTAASAMAAKLRTSLTAAAPAR